MRKLVVLIAVVALAVPIAAFGGSWFDGHGANCGLTCGG